MIRRILLLLIAILGANALKAQVAPPAPPNGLSPIAAYSVWKENVDNKLYEMALPYGRWIVTHSPKDITGYPAGRFNGPKQFSRMIEVYENLAEEKKDPTVREAYLDSAIQMYDQAIQTFVDGEIDPNDWKLNKGRFYQKNTNYFGNGLSVAYDLYEEVIMDAPEDINSIADGYYIQITLANLVSQGEKERALAMIDAVEATASEKLLSVIDNVRDKLFDSPEERITFLQSQLEKNENDLSILGELADLYSRLEYFDEATEIAMKLYKLAPTSKNTFRVAKIEFDNAIYREAIGYYEQVLNKTSDKDTLKEVNLRLAESYKNVESYEKARSFARAASKLDSQWGQPYLMISEIYAAAVSNCSGGQVDRNDKAVYWLVLDYLDKAKSVDSSTNNIVARRYNSYTPVTPSVEDKFYQGWEKGITFQVDATLKSCYSWINESTTVR